VQTTFQRISEVSDQIPSALPLSGAVPEPELSRISRATLQSDLGAEVIIHKTVTHPNQTSNTEDSLQTCAEVAESFLANDRHAFVYVDEFGFTLATQCSSSRSVLEGLNSLICRHTRPLCQGSETPIHVRDEA
jgi:hypothetical protein